ncbi:ABC transporter ATP-binding protein [Cupriavidus pauculus]|uniref:ABC transporter ATP-binding protein n=1 Tax=Cupriavidus pauculus TaxID=82633 RepID=A0A5P2H9I5_9BURK|nr:ABC transporter ATP-binding protein [Cupriavidus pauculus]QET04867.1 ABC transporter ATP-binding protein [Cupriavidus pauculus]
MTIANNAPTPAPLLSVRNLTLHSNGGTAILKGISFEMAPGEVLALVGESGSGKTMAGRAIMRLLPAQVKQTGGTITLDGKDVAVLSDRAMRGLRGQVAGMVFQEPMVSLNPAMTVGAQLCEGLLLHEKLAPKVARERAIEMLRRVQIADPETCMASFPHAFSGGMRQRIMLASVMLLKPRLLIADEPTTALDALSQREVMEIMADLTRNSGTAVLLVTHDLQLVAHYADSVLVLRRGDQVEYGSARTVLCEPNTAYTRSLIDALPRRAVGRPAVADAPPVIEARDVSVAYPGAHRMFSRGTDKLAVDRVSLAIRAGEVVAVVGGSGSGKTTLGRAMIGLLPLAGGTLQFRGQPVGSGGRQAQREFRLACQMVFQDPYSSLDPRQRIGEIVAEPLDHAGPMTAGERRLRVDRMLAEVGLDGLAERFPHALSGGQRQRVAIARALIRNPALVVADEPVSALDMTIQKQVLTLFRELQRTHGFACFFVSHNLAAVSEVADRIVVMHQGRIVEEGSVDDILDRPQHAYTRALLEAAYVAPGQRTPLTMKMEAAA